MSNAPVYNIDVEAFWRDPYPDLAAMRADAPIAYVPQLDATLITLRNDIAVNEKKIDVFSSDQPEGLMTVLMGQNMMRKDGDDHMRERKAVNPSMSRKTVREVWMHEFRDHTTAILDGLAGKREADLFWEYAMPVSADALRSMTGLTNMSAQEMNRVSQGMIDGCSNYTGDPEIEARCHECTASIDRHIDEMMPLLAGSPNYSMLSVQMQADLPEAQNRANIKLAISGGQNEPRDAIAGAIWALLTHPEQLQQLLSGEVSWLQAFEEYARWISPIGMSPRRVAREYEHGGVRFDPEDRVFFMFSSGNRDESVFENPDVFDISRDITPSLSFGAGPHFCAGAWASRALIADVALPLFFETLGDVEISGEVPFGGWAFRGPLALPCRWRPGAV